MANPFVKSWKYLMAFLSFRLDEHGDPKVQIQQAIDDAKIQHQKLVDQAGTVIGNLRQLEMQLNRKLEDFERAQASTQQALALADDARSKGNNAQADEYEKSAEAFATQMLSLEASVEELKTLHGQATEAAKQAKQAVERNEMVVQQKLAERTKLLSQLEQTKMQEQVSASLRSMSELAAPSNTPSLDQVRDKIERRYSKALGTAELARESVGARMLDVQQSTTDMAARKRIEQIRAAMNKPAGEVTSGEPQPQLKAADPEKPHHDKA